MELNLIHIVFVLGLPVAGGIAAGLSGNKKAPFVATAAIGAGLLLAVWLVFQIHEYPFLSRWEWLPGMELGWAIDRVSAVLMALVLFIAFLVHLFSVYYMKGDAGMARYYAKLGFFTSSMLGLLAADHILLLFIFWELVGFSSYLLIGFWFRDSEKSRSAKIAFMVNRVADACLLVGVILVMAAGNTPFISELTTIDPDWISMAGFCLAVGAFGKSAQFPFFGWLPRAMAGPTPVSALIHAATMVTAGVYLLVRMEPILTPEIRTLVAFIGGITAFMAAVAALTQHDIKKVLAFSTISQLGYMVMGVGVGAYQASVFHLWTHAFFKAGLFLAAGAVIHYLHEVPAHGGHFDAQDMRKMGGLRKVLPVTFFTYLLCGLALSGLPFFSGFLSKEGIITGSWLWGMAHSGWGFIVPAIAFVTAFLTPFYIGRQILLVFYGNNRLGETLPARREPAFTVRVPLALLAIASLWFWNAASPFDAHGWFMAHFLFPEFPEPEGSAGTGRMIMLGSMLLAGGGLALAYFRYRPKSRFFGHYASAGEPAGIFAKLSYNSWYADRAYHVCHAGFLRMACGAAWLDRKVIDPLVDFIGVSMATGSKLTGWFDHFVVDGIVNFVARLAKLTGRVFTGFQSPSVQTQLSWLVLVLIIILIWFQF